MMPRLADVGRAWDAMLEGLADTQAELLRRTHTEMTSALDRAARRDIEGAADWRDLQNTGDRYADRPAAHR